MKRPVTSARLRSNSAVPPRGYTLVEILVATALTLMLMAAVVQVFAMIGSSVSASRATLEMTDRLRAAEIRLQMDLKGFTVTTRPPRSPETAEGYLEIIEGPMGISPDAPKAVDSDRGNAPDDTVRDFDDILMFTTHSTGRPFVGRCAGTSTGTIESHLAEICWFVRGRTLYRRVMLIAPGAPIRANPAGFFADNDISVRNQGGTLVANTLSDLTKRECRYAHDTTDGPDSFPFDARGWGQLGLPTLGECSHGDWIAGGMAPIRKSASEIDLWNNPHPWDGVCSHCGNLSGYEGPRIGEDVILTDVIGFDVKVWDPGANAGAGAYVDLSGNVDPRSGLAAGNARVYDTWSLHYEHDGIDQFQDGKIDWGTNGFDDDANGVVDDAGEQETSPPYPFPLRGIQIKIRVFEPDSRRIREVTIVQDFLPK